MSETVARLAKPRRPRRGPRYPALVSIGVHLVITPFLLWLAATANPPEARPGEFVAEVEAPAPLEEKLKPCEPLPTLPLEEPVPAALPEDEPVEAPVFRQVEVRPLPRLSSEIAVCSERTVSLKPLVSRRPEPEVAAAPVKAPVPVRRPAGPSRRAAPLAGNSPPTYPRLASTRGIEGTVLLCVEVSPKGKVREIRIQESSGHRNLDQAAVKAVRGWSFRPALRAGVPVPAMIEVPIYFELRG